LTDEIANTVLEAMIHTMLITRIAGDHLEVAKMKVYRRSQYVNFLYSLDFESDM
jgi:hypothetical protein